MRRGRPAPASLRAAAAGSTPPPLRRAAPQAPARRGALGRRRARTLRGLDEEGGRRRRLDEVHYLLGGAQVAIRLLPDRHPEASAPAPACAREPALLSITGSKAERAFVVGKPCATPVAMRAVVGRRGAQEEQPPRSCGRTRSGREAVFQARDCDERLRSAWADQSAAMGLVVSVERVSGAWASSGGPAAAWRGFQAGPITRS